MRGEPGRVAERVRMLLEESGRAPAPTVSRSSGGGGAAPPAVPAGRRALRLDPGRRGALAVGAAVVAAAVLTGVWVLAARPSTLPVAARTSSSAPSGSASSWAAAGSAPASSSSTSPPAPSASSTLVVVDVAGRVRRPGLYRLPAGARVDDAIRAAGGARPGVKLDTLNLAAKLVDGQQVAVGVAPAANAGGAAGTAGGTDAGAPAGGPVNLNTAGLDQLQTLPGVGPVLAQHILDWRTQHGSFSSVDQLDDVTGIGDVKFAALKPLVAV